MIKSTLRKFALLGLSLGLLLGVLSSALLFAILVVPTVRADPPTAVAIFGRIESIAGFTFTVQANANGSGGSGSLSGSGLVSGLPVGGLPDQTCRLVGLSGFVSGSSVFLSGFIEGGQNCIFGGGSARIQANESTGGISVSFIPSIYPTAIGTGTVQISNP